jgi:hypothetical protein
MKKEQARRGEAGCKGKSQRKCFLRIGIGPEESDAKKGRGCLEEGTEEPEEKPEED